MKYTEILKDPTWVKDIKVGVVSEDGLANYLIRTVPVSQMAKLCASYIFNEVTNDAEPIVITEEAFKTHFRIKGWKDIDGFSGTKEARGRYSTKENH